MARRGILFCIRFADDKGFVWRTVVDLRDRVAAQLNEYDCHVAFPRLTGQSVHAPCHMQPVELDCYTLNAENKRKLAQFVAEQNIACIVYMSALPTTLDLPFLRSLGLKTINTEEDSFDHSRRDPALKRLAKFMLRRILQRQLHDLHIANSESQGRWLKGHAFIPENRMVVIPNGVDTAHFSPADTATGDKLRVVCVAQARAEKRIDLIMRCAARILAKPEFAHVTFTYVGDGVMGAQWRREAQQLGLCERFIFAGAQTDLLPFYRGADLLVHAAERESFGLVLAEAMACGLPVVASAAAGPREIIMDGATGKLVPIADEAGFQAAIERYLQDATMLREHGKAARARAVEAFSIERQARDLAAAIRGALA